MTKQELYGERKKRMQAALELKEYDRVPIAPKLGFFYGSAYGIPSYATLTDLRNAIPGIKAYLDEYQPDSAWPPAVYPTLPDGSYWGGGEGMSRLMRGAELLCAAAESISDTLKEVHEFAWPVCAVHGRDSATDIWDDEPVALIEAAPWWWCTGAGHALAPVGQLTAKIAKTMGSAG